MKSFKLFAFQEFVNFLKKENVIYALLIVNIIDATFNNLLINITQINTFRIINNNIALKLSEKL